MAEVRECSICGRSLADKYNNAVTCKDACRQKAYRRRLKARENLRPTADLWERYDSALGIVDTLGRDERLDLLAAVVWPTAAVLSEAA